MMLPQPLQLFLPEEPLPEDAQLAYLVGKQPSQAGVWLEVFVYRARRMVHVYRLESHGRRHYRSLIYTSDARYCLRELQPSTDHRGAPWPDWGRRYLLTSSTNTHIQLTTRCLLLTNSDVYSLLTTGYLDSSDAGTRRPPLLRARALTLTLILPLLLSTLTACPSPSPDPNPTPTPIHPYSVPKLQPQP